MHLLGLQSLYGDTLTTIGINFWLLALKLPLTPTLLLLLRLQQQLLLLQQLQLHVNNYINFHHFIYSQTLFHTLLTKINQHEGWSSQCWKKHNSGSIQTPDGEFRRPFGILCTYQCFLWFQPV